MKVNYKLIFFWVFFLGSSNLFSQEVINDSACSPENSEYITRYTKLKAMYVDLQNTESTKEYIALQKSFKEKAHYEEEQRETILQGKKGVNALFEWVRNNVEKTDFKSCEEAETEISKILAVNMKIISENKELYSYYLETYKFCETLVVDLFFELKKEYGDDLRL